MRPDAKGPGFADNQLKRKRRRVSSATKNNATQFFQIDSNKNIAKTLTQNNESIDSVQFADHVLRLNRELKPELYQLIITNRHFYLFKDKSGAHKVSYSFNSIEVVCLSHQSDNFMLIKLKRKPDKFDPDIVLISRRKTQITQILSHQTRNENSYFPLSITDRFTFHHVDKQKYVMIFTRTDYGVETPIYHDNINPELIPKKKKKGK